MMSAHTDAIEILLVDSNPGDVRLVQETFRKTGLTNALRVATNGEDALAAMRDASPPDLILLDLQLAVHDAPDIVRMLSGDSSLREIPVFVLATPDDPCGDDVERLDPRPVGCIAKPFDRAALFSVVQDLDTFAFSIVKQLPE